MENIPPHERIRRYYPAPPIIGTYFEFIDVNKDERLRNQVSKFFHKKVIKWINNYPEFSHLKKIKSKIDNDQGYILIYSLIKKFVDETNINWYDLKQHYSVFKDYLRFKLSEI